MPMGKMAENGAYAKVALPSRPGSCTSISGLAPRVMGFDVRCGDHLFINLPSFHFSQDSQLTFKN